MKLLTVAVPCYNSASYMRKCLDLMVEAGGEELEVVIVNDGSTDQTLSIAREYEANFPSIVRVIDKENGGHGSGVNAGLAAATGVYYRVCDSDDYLEPNALRTLLNSMRAQLAKGMDPDAYFTNFVYDKQYENTHHTNSLSRNMQPGKLLEWNDIRSFRPEEYMLMHSMTIKTQVLRDCGLKLPEHTFYVDELYCYQPLPYIKKFMYLDIELYWYFIGRPDQSVTVENIKKRYKMQLVVVTEMFRAYSYEQLKALPKKLFKYMLHTIRLMAVVATAYVYMGKGKERVEDLKAFKRDVRKINPSLARRVFRNNGIAIVLAIPHKLAQLLYPLGYRFYVRKLKIG